MDGVQRCPFVKLKADTAGVLVVRYTKLKKPLRGRVEQSVQADTKRRSEVNMAKYRGSQCITDCSGHRAGAAYFRRGGRSLTRSSGSFNRGMRIAQGDAKKRGQRTRLGITKKSK